MLQDLRFSMRSLLKQPAFTSIAVLTLALGIGATAGVFSLIQGVLLTPPPYQQPQRLVLISPARTDGKQMEHAPGWPAERWMDWQRNSRSLEGIAAYDWSFNFLVLRDGSESLEGMWVTRDYFRIMGLHPILGRIFNDSETEFRPKPVIILGYNLWRRKFNGDPAIIGRKIRISRWETPPEVIGVMPPGIRFLPSPTTSAEPNYNPNARVDFWIPAAPDPKRLKQAEWNVVARLRSGSTLNQAQTELTVLTVKEAQNDRDFVGITPRVESLTAELNRDGNRILWPLLGAAVLVLLIACGNTASLMLVRGLQRQQEYAVRTALGVRRVALFWQASSENLIVALCGGLFGIGLAVGITKLFKLIGGDAIPRLDAVTTGWPILTCGLVTAILSAVLSGLVPAFRASRLDPVEVLKSAGPKSSMGRGERKLLRGVAMTQTALTLALLVGAGLLIKTMNKLSQVQLGYDTSHVLTMSVTAVQGNWNDFHRRALERVSALPGVEHAAFAWGVPLTGNNWPDTVEVEGQPTAARDSDRLSFPLRSVTPDYFKLMGMPILDGRGFRSTDSSKDDTVAIVNRALAHRYFPNQNAIGKKLWLSGRKKPSTRIVGIVANSLTDDLTQKPQPEIYLSFWQAGPFSKHLVVRTAAEPKALAAAIQRELHLVDPTVAVENVKTMDEIRGDALASRTFATQLLTGFSLVGSLLTLIGIYGVLSLSVASRRREIAIRTAMGAERHNIRNLVFREGFRLIAGGLISGLAAAFVLAHVLRSFLFRVQPTDPATLTVVGALFAAVALLACWVPSRRAIAVDPAEALRYE
ncbi:MAG TPA: ABC transporter permease [Bryobacteraceae bacterium]